MYAMEELNVSEEEFDKVYAVNMKSIYLATIHAVPAFRANKGGSFINIASTEGLGATEGASAYTAAKHGVVGLTRALAVELGREGITVNCVCPGPINTKLTSFIEDKDKATFARRRVPLQRYGEPEEVAHATLNFALPSASFMTGTTLQVDGGLWIRNA
jgi:3-oxoacyl-[acyl-carrier protein] reductase